MNRQPHTFHLSEDVLERLAAGHPFLAGEKEFFAAHLYGCAHCQERYAHWAQFVAAFRAAVARIAS